MPKEIPKVIINRTFLDPLLRKQFDLELIGDCDEIIKNICKLLNWNLPYLQLQRDHSSSLKSVFHPPNAYQFGKEESPSQNKELSSSTNKESSPSSANKEEEENETAYEYTCDGCGNYPIKEIIWQCTSCFDYSLCNRCYLASLHNHHKFEKICKT